MQGNVGEKSVVRNSTPCGHPTSEVFNVEHLGRAAGDQRRGFLAFKRLVVGESNRRHEAVRGSADGAELCVVLAEPLLRNHEEVDALQEGSGGGARYGNVADRGRAPRTPYLARGELGKQDVPVHRSHAARAELIDLQSTGVSPQHQAVAECVTTAPGLLAAPTPSRC